VGCFSVDVELTNHSDELFQQLIPGHQVRSTKVQGLVDSGATMPILPEQVASALGLPDSGQVAEVTLADGSTITRRIFSDLKLQYQDRSGIFDAVVEPGRQETIIGAIVLERLDLLVDCPREKLIPRKPGKLTFRA
jgi:predicted aspartyl protease